MSSNVLRACVLAYLFASLAPNLRSQQSVPPELIQYPDLIVHNAKIVTMEDAGVNTSTGRTVQAMAVRGDRILFLGSKTVVLRDEFAKEIGKSAVGPQLKLEFKTD